VRMAELLCRLKRYTSGSIGREKMCVVLRKSQQRSGRYGDTDVFQRSADGKEGKKRALGRSAQVTPFWDSEKEEGTKQEELGR